MITETPINMAKNAHNVQIEEKGSGEVKSAT